MKKQKLSILLLLCLTIPIISTITVLHIQKSLLKKAVKQHILSNLSNDELVMLTFSQKDLLLLEWENQHEFEYQGTMYDVVSSKTLNDTTFFYCFPDNHETMLNKKLNNVFILILENNPNTKNTNKHFQQFLKSLFYHDFNTSFIISQPMSLLHSAYFFSPTFLFLSVASPPPKFS